MDNIVRETLVAVLVSLGAASIGAPLIYGLLLRIRSRQTISQHVQEHAHKQGTPTMGGLIVLVGLVAGMVSLWHIPEVRGLSVLVAGFALVGFLDDFVVPRMAPGKRGLGWIPKLVLEIGSALVAAWMSGYTDPLAMGLFVFMVLFFSNAYNFADGLDTLAGGLGVQLSVGFVMLAGVYALAFLPLGGVTSLEFPFAPVVMVGSVLAVAFLPFLILNAPPAKVFMGDVGALPIGAVFGWASMPFLLNDVESTMTNVTQLMQAVPLVLLSLVMLAEIVPVPLQIGSVKLLKRRLFPFKTPIHHGFQEKGWPETRITWMFHIVQAVCMILAVSVAIVIVGTESRGVKILGGLIGGGL